MTLTQGLTEYYFDGVSPNSQVVATPTIYAQSSLTIKRYLTASWNVTFPRTFFPGSPFTLKLYAGIPYNAPYPSTYEYVRVLISAVASTDL
jgi:hypothetical protein